MGPVFVVTLLAMATACQGAALFDQNRMKRDLNMDQTFSFSGVHLTLSYADAAQPLKGGKISLKVDDVKKIFPHARISKIVVKFQFKGEKVKDGVFGIVVNYGFLHGDGEWEEGKFDISRFHNNGNIWTNRIITESNKYSGKPLVPAAISNFEFRLISDKQNHFEVLYANHDPGINRYMFWSINKVSLKKINLKIANGQNPRTYEQMTNYKYDLNFISDHFETDIRKMDGVFNVTIEGTSLGETLTGKFTGSKKDVQTKLLFAKDVHVIQFDLEKGNRKLIQLDTEIKIHGLFFQAFTRYALLDGKIQGGLFLEVSKGGLILNNVDKKTKEKLEMIVQVHFGETMSLEIEGKKNRESMWTFRTRHNSQSSAAKYEMTLEGQIILSSDSRVHKFLAEMDPYGAFSSKGYRIKIFVDRLNWNLLAPKFKIEVHHYKDGAKSDDMTVDTTGSPYVFNLSGFANYFELVEYTLIDNSLSAKLTLGNDYLLEPKITWKGKLPETKREFETFMLENNVNVDVGNLDFSLDWKLMNPNLGTPQDARISLNATVKNFVWWDYALSREINWRVENRIVEVDWSGLDWIENCVLGSPPPIETSFQFKVLLDKNDLIGKFMKKVDGKEYSIDFPEGSGVMPKITIGQ